jgi:hypothetical protein
MLVFLCFSMMHDSAIAAAGAAVGEGFS